MTVEKRIYKVSIIIILSSALIFLLPTSFFTSDYWLNPNKFWLNKIPKVEKSKIEVSKEKGEEASRFFYNDTYISGMHYRTFSYWKNEGGAVVANITKDSLEVAFLLQQLKTKLP